MVSFEDFIFTLCIEKWSFSYCEHLVVDGWLDLKNVIICCTLQVMGKCRIMRMCLQNFCQVLLTRSVNNLSEMLRGISFT